MKMVFVELTVYRRDLEHQTIWVNVQRLCGMSRDKSYDNYPYTTIHIDGMESGAVQETPEQILQKIRVATE